MAVTDLKKAELYYHKSVQEEVAEVLQHSGVCQIIEDVAKETAPAEIEARLLTSEDQLSQIRYLTRTLSAHYSDPVSSMERLLGERPVVSLADLARLSDETDLKKIASNVRDCEHSLNELRMEMTQLEANERLLSTLKAFPHPLAILTEGTQTVAGFTGLVRSDQIEPLKKSLAPHAKGIELFVLQDSPQSKEAQIVVLHDRGIGSEVSELCVRNGMAMVELPASFRGTAEEELSRLATSRREALRAEGRLLETMRTLATEWMPTVQKLSDYWNSLGNRYRAFSASDETDRTLRTRFWVPAEAAGTLQKRIEAIGPAVALFLSDPSADDAPPTCLQNGSLVRPFNVLTTLYSPPVYGQTDPTPLLAPFFFLFFGMCLGDAGYALVMLGVIGLLFKKYRRIPSSIKDFVTLFAYSAVATFVYGVISGSFFGNFIDAFLPALVPLKNSLMLVDPMANPMQVLGISLFLGVIHLMFGLLIAARDHIRRKEYADAVGDKIAWFLLVSGLCLFGVGVGGMLPAVFGQAGKFIAAAGAILIFWHAGREKKNIFAKALSGFLALYGSTSYLGDILSYSRLLALGFGSAVIGMIINLLGGMSVSIPYVGWLVAVVVVVGGHFFSILVNILGAFVHPLRLQYVEFFGKFYTGGGTAFTPLNLSGEYVEITQPTVKP